MITNQMLATYPFLCRLSAESRRLLDAGAKALSVTQGQTLLRRGDVIRGVYLVLAGRLRVYTLSAEGGEASLYVIETGESCPLAMNALLADKRRRSHQAWVEVESKTARLWFIPAAIFKDLYENEPVVREFALTVLSDRISGLMDALEDISLRSMGERLRGHLLRSADAQGEVEATHQKLAHVLGTAREVVSRLLRRFEKAGLITRRRGRIKVLDVGGRIREGVGSPGINQGASLRR
jgi:CRP/FNR family transcriptional regulator, anaerobic regulatory protein